MYRYEYERITANFSSWGIGGGNVYKTEDYRSLIDKRALEGWRFVGVIPASQRGTGHVDEMDLVFEKED